MSDGDRIHIGTVDEFEEEEPRRVEVENRNLCVVRSDGEFYALGDRCPHKGGPLHHGEVNCEVTEDFEGTPSGQRPELTHTDNKVIVCPWHGWEFDLETGEHAGDPAEGLPTYDVHFDEEDVYIEL